MKALNLVGRNFGSLEVVELVRDDEGRIKWRCLCVCGSETISFGYNLTRNGVSACRSCAYTIHGMSTTPEFWVLQSMKQRCYNPNHKQYADYGGRGIIICDQWLNNPLTFFQDMGPRPTPKHTIERENNDVGYFPHNCHWATRTEQMNNTRSNHFYEHDGKCMTIGGWSKILNVSTGMLQSRLRSGMDFEEAISKPRRPRRSRWWLEREAEYGLKITVVKKI